MKNYKIFMILVVSALPFLAGCPESKTITTKINRDGSCVRTIGDFDPRDFKGIDSVIHDLPIPVDHSWNLKLINDSTAVLAKEFDNVSEINASFLSDESELKMYKREVELTKKFRWFHTVLHFRETYEGILTEIPLTRYMSEAEAETFKMEDSEENPIFNSLESRSKESLIDNIEERFEYWLMDNIFSIAFDDIMEIADSLMLFNNRTVNASVIKDSVKQRFDELEKSMIFSNSNDEMEMADIAKMIGEEIRLDSIELPKLVRQVERAKLEDRYDDEIFGGFMENYENKIMLPGLVTDTNAEILAGDTLIWDVDPIKFCDSDFVMFAESKVTNRWAYLLSGFIILIAVMIPFLGKLRK